MSEPSEQRLRRKRQAGALDQTAAAASACSVGVFIVGFIAPVIALALSPGPRLTSPLSAVLLLAMASAVALLLAARELKAQSKALDDDSLAQMRYEGVGLETTDG